MRKVAMISIAVCSIGMGLPYALKGQWWGLFACLLAGVLWCYPSRNHAKRRSTISLSILAFMGILGIYFNHPQLWSLTSFVFLLISWDLDHYTLVFQKFEKQSASENASSVLFYTHLKYLFLFAGLGWCFGLVALNLRFQISFSVALVLIVLLIYSLRQVARYLGSIQK